MIGATMDLFSLNDADEEAARGVPHEELARMPLAARMRPRQLDDVAGQEHLLGEGKLLRRAIETDRFTSLIFYGPPGVGKTTLASVIARTTDAFFVMLNGVESNVAEVRERIAQAEMRMSVQGKKTVLFVDELHRFNKAQQDVLLPYLEKGTVRFIGATTENPYFAINSPLLSRSQVFPLEPVPEKNLVDLLNRALNDSSHGLGAYKVDVSSEALAHLARKADGDARKALTALEVAVLSTPAGADGVIHVDLSVAEESIQKKAIKYDRLGDSHYDTISAFIKSMRGSDPDAALYWLATMLEAGEDVRFIARRIVIAASEDVGLADSNALRVAMDAARAAEMLGMPEARIPLAHATVYLATAPKSNSAYMGIAAALQDVKAGKTLAVPAHLRTPTRKKLAAAGGVDDASLQYLYAHDYEEHYVPQAYLPEGRTYYTPTNNGLEMRIAERMEHRRLMSQKDETKNLSSKK
ncbi:MAG: replication-associated recombination protein A [Akkermansia sp.]